MKRIVRLKINVSNIEKARLFQGAKGTYLDATVFLDDESDQYDNNGMITQDVSKEDRENGIKGNILGNAKIFKILDDDRPVQAAQATPQRNSDIADGLDDIPF